MKKLDIVAAALLVISGLTGRWWEWRGSIW